MKHDTAQCHGDLWYLQYGNHLHVSMGTGKRENLCSNFTDDLYPIYQPLIRIQHDFLLLKIISSDAHYFFTVSILNHIISEQNLQSPPQTGFRPVSNAVLHNQCFGSWLPACEMQNAK